MAFGFGPLPSAPAGITMEDIARLFGQAPMGAPQGFSGSSTAPAPDVSMLQPAPAASPQSVAVPLPPQRPLSFGPLPKPQTSAAPEADLPAPGAQPIMGQAPAMAPSAPVPEEPSFLQRFGEGLNKNSDMLIGLGTGLMSTPGFGAGLSAGFQNAQKARALSSTTDLARAELGLKQQKLARETRGENATARAIAEKLGIPIEQAQGFAGNPAFVSEFLKGNYGAPEGFTRTADGLSPLQGGPQDVNTLRARSQAQAEGTAAGKPEDPTADQKNYEEAKKQGYTKSFIDYQLEKANASRAQTTVNATVNPILKGLADQFTSGSEAARASADVVRAVQNARSQIDAPGGIIAGKFADERLALQKLGSFLGASDPQSIVNTETFRTQIKPIVLETVKGLGAGSGVSNADRDFALQAVGGDINLDPGSIKRVLDITERAARAKVDRHNTLSDQMLETQPELRQIAPMLRIAVPEAAAPAPTQPAPQTAAPSDPLAAARAAIARGAPRSAVMQRLLQSGIDPKGL